MTNMKDNVYHYQKRKGRKRSIDAGVRPFKLDIKNRLLMLLVYYRLYITCMISGFLFDLDQSNICCRDIQKIELLIRECVPILQKINKITKRLRTPEGEVERYIPDFITFIDSTLNSRYNQDLKIKKEESITFLE